MSLLGILSGVRAAQPNAIAPRRFFRAHALHLATEFDDQAVMDDAIDRSRGGQGRRRGLSHQGRRPPTPHRGDPRCCTQGEVLLTPAQWARIRAWEEGAGARWQRLSARERDVLILLAEGKTTAGIAEVLEISENTVRTHVGNLLGKLEVDSREAAIAWAWKHGFVEGGNGAEGC